MVLLTKAEEDLWVIKIEILRMILWLLRNVDKKGG